MGIDQEAKHSPFAPSRVLRLELDQLANYSCFGK
jgi:hypothetical protein